MGETKEEKERRVIAAKRNRDKFFQAEFHLDTTHHKFKCLNCGYEGLFKIEFSIARCPSCDLSLSYLEENNKLKVILYSKEAKNDTGIHTVQD
jgi:Zn finger protein HypA/HybF involved in hydrogenase expression